VGLTEQYTSRCQDSNNILPIMKLTYFSRLSSSRVVVVLYCLTNISILARMIWSLSLSLINIIVEIISEVGVQNIQQPLMYYYLVYYCTLYFLLSLSLEETGAHIIYRPSSRQTTNSVFWKLLYLDN
jgi:hypothetical protein